MHTSRGKLIIDNLKKSSWLIAIVPILLFGFLSGGLRAQDSENADTTVVLAPSVPVLHHSDTLFYVVSAGDYRTAKERALAISRNLLIFLDRDDIDIKSINSFRDGEIVKITYEGVAKISLYPEDTTGTGLTMEAFTEEVIQSVENHITNRLGFGGIALIAKRFGLLAGLILAFFLLVKLLNRGMTRGNRWITSRIQKRIEGYTSPGNRFFTMRRLADLVAVVLRLIKFVLIIIIVYLLLPLGFSIFPSTEDIALKLLGYVVDPIKSFGTAFINYIPQLIAIIVIILIARAFIKLTRYIAKEVEYERLKIDGFYPDWAQPTYNLLKVLIIIFAFVSVFPLIPGSGSDVFKGVSVFLGILISLGSSSAIGNIIAGLVITYMRPYKIGDRVRIGDATGDVVEKTLLITRLRTIKNEDVTIPNSSILAGNTFNFSANAKEKGLILNASVTIGYDVPWRKVHEMLIEAATRTSELLQEPKPFVLQTGLDDFYVSYQINCFTEKAEIAASIYSNLYGNIQDVFAENKIEILSPHYRAERDGSSLAFPEKALGKTDREPDTKENEDAKPQSE